MNLRGPTYPPPVALYVASRFLYDSIMTFGKSRGANLFETNYELDVSKWYYDFHKKHMKKAKLYNIESCKSLFQKGSKIEFRHQYLSCAVMSS